MLFQVSMFPTSTGKSSVSAEVARVIDLIDRSGLPYKLGAMATVIEGEWEPVMALLNRARRMLRRRGHERVYMVITIDDRKGAKNRLAGKVLSVEEKLGREVMK
ncbi:MAG TPA: MTH1187 family thiamine-binding protein [candidate division Zixibacteria bacterium]|nr:MTH1187 family thiamine-binding protein [candidate division Zixibacteria bacterium]MDD4918513.1 MTH1187 family thiamine-binding protein [candidate division Zixibacteria bacterium]MDM7973383.1 MTH1187 family thiamine-binding protein [candidate division Zixibacteria bacterium]HOD67364.1 MTH1187 family thiamine-binding protein [candidate division Zixibacteria bacterium]HPI33063.1 MTH1187 family thiamine-binding protein [candidate division Zixibacteria bacterium]